MSFCKSFPAFAIAAGLLAGSLASGAARADAIPYPNPGHVSSPGWLFTVGQTGDFEIWFGGKGGAGDTNVLHVFVNGAETAIPGPNNQTATVGDRFNLGPVFAGDAVAFELENQSTGSTWSSQASLNPDHLQHLYVTPFSGGSVGGVNVPAGLYLAFEDLSPAQGTDWNYQDLQFYAPTLVAAPAAPEPATWALLLMGFAALGLARRGLPFAAAS